MNKRRERFKRVAVRRTNSVLKGLQVLGNCANKSAYEYSEEEVDKIFNEIERVIRLTKMKFKLDSNKHEEFKL